MIGHAVPSMSSVKMIGIAEHCDLPCDWIIKAIFLRRSLHRLWHSAAGIAQDKLLLRLDCTLHQWCNYEIDVVLIQISIWKPIIDRYCWFGGSSLRAERKICSAGDEFWSQTHMISDTRSCSMPNPTLMSIVAGQPFLHSWRQKRRMVIYPVQYLCGILITSCFGVWVGLLIVTIYHSRIMEC